MEVGPCRADPAKAIVGGADNSQLKFECPGGEITVGANNQSILLTSLKGLSPFETYRVVVGAGLEDQAGRTRKVPIESTFQVKSNVPCAPSTLESGFFFTIFNIEAPARGTFQYLFWIQVDAATGQIRLYGTKIVPNDGIDPLTNQNFKDWQINTDPQKESFISASGQTAEVSGEKVIVVHPFVLRINQPKITAEGVELNGLMSTAVIPGASSDQRDVIQGRLSSPAIFLGEGESESNLGPGYGTASFFRLLPSEAPTFEDGIPTAYTAAEIQADFGNCD